MGKACRRCNEQKPISDFYRDESRPDGLTLECRECRKELNRLWYQANAAKKLLQARSYHAEHREQIVQRKRQRYAEKKSQGVNNGQSE